jgi:hypothetical protein
MNYLHPSLARYRRRVYLSVQDEFFFQPLRVYLPLLALLLGPGRGLGGVASSERLKRSDDPTSTRAATCTGCGFLLAAEELSNGHYGDDFGTYCDSG